MQETVDLSQQDQGHTDGHDYLHADAEEGVDLGVAADMQFVQQGLGLDLPGLRTGSP